MSTKIDRSSSARWHATSATITTIAPSIASALCIDRWTLEYHGRLHFPIRDWSSKWIALINSTKCCKWERLLKLHCRVLRTDPNTKFLPAVSSRVYHLLALTRQLYDVFSAVPTRSGHLAFRRFANCAVVVTTTVENKRSWLTSQQTRNPIASGGPKWKIPYYAVTLKSACFVRQRTHCGCRHIQHRANNGCFKHYRPLPYKAVTLFSRRSTTTSLAAKTGMNRTSMYTPVPANGAYNIASFKWGREVWYSSFGFNTVYNMTVSLVSLRLLFWHIWQVIVHLTIS